MRFCKMRRVKKVKTRKRETPPTHTHSFKRTPRRVLHKKKRERNFTQAIKTYACRKTDSYASQTSSPLLF